MRISYWSSDVCSSDLVERHRALERGRELEQLAAQACLQRLVLGVQRGVGGDRRRVLGVEVATPVDVVAQELDDELLEQRVVLAVRAEEQCVQPRPVVRGARSEEHTSELQSLMRISYAVFCLKKKNESTITKQARAQ